MRALSNHKRWLTVVLFATAMAGVESAVVYDLRTMIDRIEPYQPNPLPIIGGLGPVELAREVATLVMLFTVGILAGRTWRSRLGYSAVAFGVWDICYYVFLKLICGWPHSLMDWDILFLLPLPWWGPVLAPVLIALLMIAWGTLASQTEEDSLAGTRFRGAWVLNLLGTGLALYTFMADALPVANQGTDTLRHLLPTQFNWPLFCLALALMAAPVVRLGFEVWAQRGTAADEPPLVRTARFNAKAQRAQPGVAGNLKSETRNPKQIPTDGNGQNAKTGSGNSSQLANKLDYCSAET
jgi:hypothetical protein